MYEYDENGDALAYQGDGYGEDTPLEFGPANHSAELGYGEHTADAPLAFNAQSQVPIILTGKLQNLHVYINIIINWKLNCHVVEGSKDLQYQVVGFL